MLNGYIYKNNTPQFNLDGRCQYGNGCDFKHKIIEYRGNNCFIPSKRYCFVKCINFVTGEIFKKRYLKFIRIEKRRSKFMTKARIQPFCRANISSLRYFDGIRVFPRSVTDRKNALLLHNNHFCLLWKSKGVSFNQAFKKLKDIFEIVDYYIAEEIVNSLFKYEFVPKKVDLTGPISLYTTLKLIIQTEKDLIVSHFIV